MVLGCRTKESPIFPAFLLRKEVFLPKFLPAAQDAASKRANESRETLGAAAPGLSLALIPVPRVLPLSPSCRGHNSQRVPSAHSFVPIKRSRERSAGKIHEIFSGCAELTQLFRALQARIRHGASTEQGRTPDPEHSQEGKGFLRPIPVGIFPGGSIKAWERFPSTQRDPIPLGHGFRISRSW